MKAGRFIVAVFVLLCAVAGCRYDVESNTSCSTANVTYSSTVTGIIRSYGCLAEGCHGGANPLSGFTLTDYNGVKAKESRLYGALNHAPGYFPMPQNGGKISSCDLEKIKAWLDAGAPNN